MKRPGNLTDEQATMLRKLRRRSGDVWRAYSLKEAFRAIFDDDLDATTVTTLIDRWISSVPVAASVSGRSAGDAGPAR